MNLDDPMYDIDELAKKIENRLRELEENNQKEAFDKQNLKDDIDKTIYDFSDLILQINQKIKELQEEEASKINIDEVTNKVNNKLNYMLEFNSDINFDKTIYDLSEVAAIVNQTINDIDKAKLKKARKSKYCELARQRKYSNNKTKKSKK